MFSSSAVQAAPSPRLRSLAFYDLPVTPPGVLRDTFSASLDNWMYMRTTWRHAAGEHVASYTIYSPDGQIYQVLDVPFVGQSSHETVEVWGELPVAGTWMTRMPGVWRVDVTLDGNPRVLTREQFTVTW
ncbi:MAG: hypothetical protein WCD37_10545 [Chloroflexia bacterium]